MIRQSALSLGELVVMIHHHSHELVEIDPGLPAQNAASLVGVTLEVVHLSRTHVSRIELDVLPPIQVRIAEGLIDELPD
jgi:hypothetical protein